MNLLVIGNGAREHALAWALIKNPAVKNLYVAPGNAGTAKIGTNVNVKPTDIKQLCELARKLEIDLTVVGPEVPLSLGIVDLFEENGLKVFGPSKLASQIESSKVFSKKLMQKYDIPCSQGVIFSNFDRAKSYIVNQKLPIVIKADGLAAGKGVIIANTEEEAVKALEDIMIKKQFGDAGNQVIIEEYLTGLEVSLLSFTDGDTAIPMVSACDYKRVFDNEKGPNTGGMGSYSPTIFFTEDIYNKVVKRIIEPTIQAMASEGILYKGVLYAGLILTNEGPKILEFNARFGDPETQAILPRLNSDLLDIIDATINKKLCSIKIEWSNEPCVGVVMASNGYPGNYKTGYEIEGLDQVDSDINIFHAGTKSDYNTAKILTDGGRVLTVTAKGKTLGKAREKVYENIKNIHFHGCHYRKDIALREVQFNDKSGYYNWK